MSISTISRGTGVSAEAARAREAARRPDGKFGEQPHNRPSNLSLYGDESQTGTVYDLDDAASVQALMHYTSEVARTRVGYVLQNHNEGAYRAFRYHEVYEELCSYGYLYAAELHSQGKPVTQAAIKLAVHNAASRMIHAEQLRGSIHTNCRSISSSAITGRTELGKRIDDLPAGVEVSHQHLLTLARGVVDDMKKKGTGSIPSLDSLTNTVRTHSIDESEEFAIHVETASAVTDTYSDDDYAGLEETDIEALSPAEATGALFSTLCHRDVSHGFFREGTIPTRQARDIRETILASGDIHGILDVWEAGEDTEETEALWAPFHADLSDRDKTEIAGVFRRFSPDIALNLWRRTLTNVTYVKPSRRKAA